VDWPQSTDSRWSCRTFLALLNNSNTRRQPALQRECRGVLGEHCGPHLSSQRERVVKACSTHRSSARGHAFGCRRRRQQAVRGEIRAGLCASVWPHLLCIGMPFDSPQKVRRGTVEWPSDTSHKTSGRHSLGRNPQDLHIAGNWAVPLSMRKNLYIAPFMLSKRSCKLERCKRGRSAAQHTCGALPASHSVQALACPPEEEYPAAQGEQIDRLPARAIR